MTARPALFRAGLTLALASVFSPLASAQSLDLGFSCNNAFTGESLTTGSTITWGNAFQAQCSVDYSNDSGAPLPDVWVRVTWDPFVQTDLAPALPDGVEGLAATQTWRPAVSVNGVPGNPTPIFDHASQTALIPVGDIPDLTASELYFSWTPPAAMPARTYSVHVQAYVGGAPGQGTPDAVVDVNLAWDPGAEKIAALAIPRMQLDRRFVGSAVMDRVSQPATAHTDAKLVVHLPYFNGTDLVADGNYNPANLLHIPLVNAGDLSLQLLLRNVVQQPELNYVVPAGTPLDGNGNLSGPAAGPNANRVVVYDPDTNAITANVGVVWAADELNSGGYGSWRLRWDAAPDSLFREVLTDGSVIPVQVCFQSASTGAVAPGDPRWCHTSTSEVGAESVLLSLSNVGCPAFTNYNNPCRSEAMPYVPGDDGTTQARFTNTSSLKGDAEVVVQLPGSGGARQASLTGVTVGPGFFLPTYGPEFGEADVEIWVSTGASDYSDPDVTARTLGANANWQPCVLLAGGFSPVRCDLASLPVPAADVEEVKVILKGVPSQYVSLQDVDATFPPGWMAEIGWVLHDTVAGSMNGSAYSATNTSGAAFGLKASAQLSAPDLASGSVVETATAGETGEVTRQSFVEPCGASPSAFVGQAEAFAVFCGQGQMSATSLSVMDPLRMQWGVENRGAADNVTGPFELCLPIPHGFRFEGAFDATDPVFPGLIDAERFGFTLSGTATFLDPSAYSYTFTPRDHVELAGDLCVQVPTYTLAAGHSLQAIVDGRIIPGVHATASFYNPDGFVPGTYQAHGEGPAGQPLTHTGNLNASWADITGTAKITITNDISPSTLIGNTTNVCYDYQLDTHAFRNDGTLDPDGATLPTEQAVSYQWIPRSDVTQPDTASQPSTGDTLLVTATSPDAVATWVHTAEAPERGDATTLVDNGWVLCANQGTDCDAAALSLLSLTPADVRWVAFELGRLDVSDAEPRGVAPFDGNARVNVPYAVSVCVVEDGSADGSEIATVLESRSRNLLPVVTEPAAVTVASGCPAGSFGVPETCNGLDDDCDGLTDDDVCLPDAGTPDAALDVDAAVAVDAAQPADAATEPDAGPGDSGVVVPDAATPDATTPDATTPDAYVAPDAAFVPDASVAPDAAATPTDAGVPADTGVARDAAQGDDASVSGDGGVSEQTGNEDEGSIRANPCACDVTPRSGEIPAETWLLALGVVLYRRKRAR
ncbi:MAG: hypothetical protein AB2A00_10245 [Myxococcota bacterium]